MEFYYCNDVEANCTITLFTLDFRYQDEEFHCLVRAKAQGNVVLYFLTLLNPDMDEVFRKPIVLTERERLLFTEAPIRKKELSGVKFASIIALRNYLDLYQAADQFNERYIA